MRPEVRMARYIEVLERYCAGRLGCGEAGGGGPDRVRRRAIPDTLLRFHGEALP
jgi:hypothetical protein